MRGALVVLRNGGTTTAAAHSYDRFLAAFGHPAAPVVWRLDYVAASSPTAGEPDVVIQLVGPISANLTRVSQALQLARHAADGAVDPTAIARRLGEIEQLATPYAGWWRWSSAALAAGSFARFAGGDPGSMWVAAVAAVLGQMARARLERLALPAASLTSGAALVSASVASLGLRLGLTDAMHAALLASVVHLAPGLALINGLMDVMSQEYLAIGLQRVASALATFLMLAVAVAMAFVVLN